MEYHVVSVSGITYFNEAVNKKLKEGWRLMGSPYSKGDSHCQALVKFNDELPSGYQIGALVV